MADVIYLVIGIGSLLALGAYGRLLTRLM